jgi:hypothetical protein
VDGAHWTLAAASFVTSGALSGARSLRCYPTSGTHSAVTVASFGVGLTVARFRVKFTTLPNASTPIWSPSGDPTTGVELTSVDSGNAFISAKANDVLGATGVPIMDGIAYCIDVRINQTANPWLVDVQVNGISCGQASVATAADTAAKQFRLGFRTGIGLTADALFDDVLISTTSADFPIGPGYVNHFVPTADGAHNIAGTADFQRGNSGTDILNATTTAFQLIDDVPLPSGTVDEADNVRAVAPPNATDYVECVFGPAAGITTPVVAPRAVEAILAHHQIATQTGQMVVELNDNGTIDTIFDTGAAAGVTTYRYARKHYVAGPAGAWVIGGGGNGDFTDLRCRFRSPDPAPDQCLDAIMLEAEFKGPLFTKQTLQAGDTVEVADAHADVPAATTYDLGTDISEAVDTVVTTVVSVSTAEGEVPQQQCVLESRGGGEIGEATVHPKQRVYARMSVATAATDAGVDGTAS